MSEGALKRRLFIGLLCMLLLTAYFIMGTQRRSVHTTMPAVVFSRTDQNQYWPGDLELRGSLSFSLLRSDRSFSGIISLPGYPETFQEGFRGTIYLDNLTNQNIYLGALFYDREKTGDAFFLGKVRTTRKLDHFFMSLTAPGTMHSLDVRDGYVPDYILIAPCTSLKDAVAQAEDQGLLEAS